MRNLAMMVGIILLFLVVYNNFDIVLDKDFRDVTKVEGSIRISSKDLVNAFQIDESRANSGFVEQTLEVTGQVREIRKKNKRITIWLNGNSDSVYVLCEMRPDQSQNLAELKPGDTAVVKGICKGYLKDAILLHCILLKNPVDE